jgi:hypothetical protein
MIAGIGIIPNIWDHYLPTLMVAVLFVASGVPWARSIRMNRDLFRSDGLAEVRPEP